MMRRLSLKLGPGTKFKRPAHALRVLSWLQAGYLLRNDGLFVGSSAAVNCVGAVRVARALGPGHTVVTLLCDGGQRHLSKFHSPQYLADAGLTPQSEGRTLAFIAE